MFLDTLDVHTSDHRNFIDDEISTYTEASFSEAEGVIRFQRLPPDDFNTPLQQQTNGEMERLPLETQERTDVTASPNVGEAQPQRYTIDKKFVS